MPGAREADHSGVPRDRRSPHMAHQPAGLHAPVGDLPVSEDGTQIQCHLCGRWLRSIGSSHLHKIHEITAEEYRVIAGLRPCRPLEAPEQSAIKAARMRQMIATDTRVQKGMARGADLARRGELQRQAEVTRRERPQTSETRRLLADGAREVNRRRGATYIARRERSARDLGFKDMADFYVRRYCDEHARLEDLARELGCAINAVRGDLRRLGLGPDRTRSHGARWRTRS
jgi:ROS/MUCR transcriptional regulator protein